MAEGEGVKANPWRLNTPPGTSTFEAWRDLGASPPALVVQVGKTQLRYHLRALEDLETMLAWGGTMSRAGGLGASDVNLLRLELVELIGELKQGNTVMLRVKDSTREVLERFTKEKLPERLRPK